VFTPLNSFLYAYRFTNSMKEILEKITPTREEEQKLKEIVREITSKIKGKDFKLVIGGSVAKGSWLPGITDIDFFMKFDYNKYKEKSFQLSSYAEKILKKHFKFKKIHGSRDYFSIKYKGYDCEIIPVLNIRSIGQARNITDISPLHVNWVARRSKVANQVRLVKQFMKGVGVYGAESYIHGFSGHVCEILSIHYGSFARLVREASKWGDHKFIDVEKHYKSEKEAYIKMNGSKIASPLNVVDPVQPERNAAAAISADKYITFIDACHKFVSRPSKNYFKEREFDIEAIKKQASKNKVVFFSCKPDNNNTDVAGCRILRKFRYCAKLMEAFDFIVLNGGWYWNQQKPAIFWYVIDPKKLSAVRRHWGPGTKDPLGRIQGFTKKWKKRVKVSNSRYYVDLKRDIRDINDFAKYIKRDKILSGVKLL